MTKRLFWTSLGLLLLAASVPAARPGVPRQLRHFILTKKEVPGFRCYDLAGSIQKRRAGTTYQLVQSFVRKDVKDGKPTGGFSLDVVVALCPSPIEAERFVTDRLGYRAVPIKWEHRTVSGRKLSADQVWSCPPGARSSGSYQLYARSGRLALDIGLAAGGQRGFHPPDPATVQFVERMAESFLARYRAHNLRGR